jgi:hypothetical protein
MQKNLHSSVCRFVVFNFVRLKFMGQDSTPGRGFIPFFIVGWLAALLAFIIHLKCLFIASRLANMKLDEHALSYGTLHKTVTVLGDLTGRLMNWIWGFPMSWKGQFRFNYKQAVWMVSLWPPVVTAQIAMVERRCRSK